MANKYGKGRNGSKGIRLLGFFALTLFLRSTLLLGAEAAGPDAAQEMNHRSTRATPLAELMEEAKSRNPQILAAVHGYKAAAMAPKRVSALPDTQVLIQQFSVGSPRPFAGYTTSDFAYIGLGFSQDVPYPGKRRLRSESAQHEADSVYAQSESISRSVIERVKQTYFHLAAVQQALQVLDHYDQILAGVREIARSGDRTSQGDQQEMLKAQLQQAKILQETAMSRREQERLQAQLKELLGRDQESADILAEPLVERPVPLSLSRLLQLAGEQNPVVQSRQAMLKQAQSQVALATEEFRPDFSLQYMYQNADRKFHDYYMLTFGFTLPNRKRRRVELAEAQEKQKGAQQDLEAEVQKQKSELRQQLATVQASYEQLKIYREKLIPQTQAILRAALAGYQTNRQDFDSLVSLLFDALDMDLQYQQELADHESALAGIEALTGVGLQ